MTRTELDRMAHDAAYHFYSGLIESSSLPASDDDGREWWKLPGPAFSGHWIDEALIYLDACGLIEHHPTDPLLVDVRDESEALRPKADVPARQTVPRLASLQAIAGGIQVQVGNLRAAIEPGTGPAITEPVTAIATLVRELLGELARVAGGTAHEEEAA